MFLDTSKRKKITKRLVRWYTAHGRHDLPWRHTDDLYRVIVSEVMLQQTNVPKVVGKYEAFLKRFPRWSALAGASAGDVMRAWQGLGYNRRALYVHRMAQTIVKKYGGMAPRSPELLGQLPGMGPYTRNAVLVFGYNADLLAMDVNIERAARRWMGKVSWRKGEVEKVIASFVPRGKSRIWHSAMMDFASLICTKKSPQCAMCPIGTLCRSYGAPRDLVRVKKKEPGRTENGKHVPRRIYRGRIVEVLRKGSVSPGMIGKKIKSDWHARSDREWLAEILEKLAQEGMIEYANGTWRLKI